MRDAMARVSGTLAGRPLGPGESVLVCLDCGAPVPGSPALEAEVRRREEAFDALHVQPACGPADPGVSRPSPGGQAARLPDG
jgi:hypothetical protein